ncbi:MAG: TrmB family transcriptional regulator [Candidatus Hodarchaeota archaeon]
MKALEELGLTNYEAKTYHTLLSIGISDAKEIHTRSGVPWGRIYDVLNTLEGKGLVESQLSRPKQFIPVEPRIALETLLELKNREMEILTEKAARIESELNEAYRKPQEESMFWNVTLGDEMGKKMLEKMADAKEEVLIYVELPKASAMLTENEKMQFIDILHDLVREGVKIQILLAAKEKNLPEELLAYLAPYMGLQGRVHVRVTPQITSCFDIIDREKVFLKVPNPLNPREYFAAIYVWQKRFAQELNAKFTEMWKNAKQLQIGIEE